MRHLLSLTVLLLLVSVSVSQQTIDVPVGSQVEITATPANGWKFDGWGGDGSGTQNPMVLTANGNINYVAQFSEISTGNTVTVTVSSSPSQGGSVSVRVIPDDGGGGGGGPTTDHRPVSQHQEGRQPNSFPHHESEQAGLPQQVFPSNWSPYRRADQMPVHPRSDTMIAEYSGAGMRIGISPIYHVINGPVDYLPVQIGPAPGTNGYPHGNYEGGWRNQGDDNPSSPYAIPHDVSIQEYDAYRRPNNPGYNFLDADAHPNLYWGMQTHDGTRGSQFELAIWDDYANDPAGDRHCSIFDLHKGRLIEFYKLIRRNNTWHFSFAVEFPFDRIPEQGRDGYNAATGSGIPYAPLLLKANEIRSGEIRHALMITLKHYRHDYVAPATKAIFGGSDNTNGMRMGERLRLSQAGYDRLRQHRDLVDKPAMQVILTCLRNYGVVVYDGGGHWWLSAAHEVDEVEFILSDIRQVRADDFEVVVAN